MTTGRGAGIKSPRPPATLAGYLITGHGRATPLIWKTVKKSELAGHRNDHEYRLL